MYNILLLDDRLQVRTNLIEKFEDQGFKVFPCRTIYDAMDIWDDNENTLDAIVFDMMMPSSGIDDKYRLLTKGGLLSGWIWLWHTLNPDKKKPHPAVNKCIVLYSGYLEDFTEYITSNEPSAEEKEFAGSVKRIPKGLDGKEEEVLNHLIQDNDKKTARN
jgi:hypothetical protein